MEPDPRWRSPGSSSWYSPRYRGGGGFRGNNYSPRQNFGNNSWQQRSQSPYNYRQQGNHYKNFNNAPYTSTPRHQNWGGGGRGRQHNRNSFGTSSNNSNSFGHDSIENWVSQQMWEDPWKNLTAPSDTKSETKFADTDFSTDSENRIESIIAADTTNDTPNNLSSNDERQSALADDSTSTPIINEDSSPADVKTESTSVTENEVPVSITVPTDLNVDATSEIDVPV